MRPETLLAFEHKHPNPTPAKHHAIRRELGISETRYYQLLLRAASTVDGMRADPVTARIVRERAERVAATRSRRVA